MNRRLSPTVSVVGHPDNVIEFFKANTRRSILVKFNDDVLPIVDALDGSKSDGELAQLFNVKKKSMIKLLAWMEACGLLDNVDEKKDFESYDRFRRVISFLNDYSHSHIHLLKMWEGIRSSRVLIVGLGAVGSWVAYMLVESGVRNFVLIDPDRVELSNLHRQFGYREEDVGRFKTAALAERMIAGADDLNIQTFNECLDETLLERLGLHDLSLVINCADKPTVDLTSEWIGHYCMKRDIPHIVGGGYNLHLSLIGQTIIPRESACVKCFAKTLAEENKIDPSRVKKLARPNRRIGSLGPMCSLVASLIGMEAIKVLTGAIKPANLNRRGEFDIRTMKMSYKNYDRRTDCEWCGT